MCCVHFAYCSILYFSQPHYCHKAKGCIAVRSPPGSGRYNVITPSGSSLQNLTTLKFQIRKKIQSFYLSISKLHMKYMKICTIQKFPTIWYTSTHVKRGGEKKITALASWLTCHGPQWVCFQSSSVSPTPAQ